MAPTPQRASPSCCERVILDQVAITPANAFYYIVFGNSLHSCGCKVARRTPLGDLVGAPCGNAKWVRMLLAHGTESAWQGANDTLFPAILVTHLEKNRHQKNVWSICARQEVPKCRPENLSWGVQACQEVVWVHHIIPLLWHAQTLCK